MPFSRLPLDCQVLLLYSFSAQSCARALGPRRCEHTAVVLNGPCFSSSSYWYQCTYTTFVHSYVLVLGSWVYVYRTSVHVRTCTGTCTCTSVRTGQSVLYMPLDRLALRHLLLRSGCGPIIWLAQRGVLGSRPAVGLWLKVPVSRMDTGVRNTQQVPRRQWAEDSGDQGVVMSALIMT